MAGNTKRAGSPPSLDEQADTLPSWANRAVDRSVKLQRSKTRAMNQAQGIVDAAQRIVRVKGAMFTTQEVVKEANVAVQTLYRHFASKDELALAVIETMVAEAVQSFEASATGIEDPIDRIRHFVQLPFTTLADGDGASTFLATERWRLQRLFPEEIERARQPFTDLIERELVAASATGRARLPSDPAHDARLVTELSTAVYYDTAVSRGTEPVDAIVERLWRFCRSALGLVHPD